MEQYPRFGPRGTQACGTSKYSTKQIKIEMFSGDVKEGFLDAGAGDWLRRLSMQIRLGEMVDGTAWPDNIKAMVAASHLEGTALIWFTRRFDALQRMTFEELSTALREKFRCPLDRVEITTALTDTKKGTNETYTEFAHRLNVIAATVNNGEVNKASVEDALSVFIKNAWPQLRPSLLGHVRTQSDDPWREMDKAVEYLTKVAGHDGRQRLELNNTLNETYDTDSDDENGTDNSVENRSNETRNGDDSEDNRLPTKTRRLNSETAQVAKIHKVDSRELHQRRKMTTKTGEAAHSSLP